MPLSNSASATASFIAPQVTLPTYLQFDLTVTDGKIDTAIPIALADITINNKILITGAGVTPNFATPIKISNSNAFHSEESALASAGTNVYVSWWDRLNVGSGTSEIFFRKIANNGATPGDIVNISKTSGGELAPAVAATGNNVYLAWVDQADFGGDDEWIR